MNENLKRLSEVGFFDIKPGLKRIKKVLEKLSNPQDKFKSVLIAGTNGKGSVASILSSILINNRYKTGLYTSPHLLSVSERIKLDGRNISENNFNNILGDIFDACNKTNTALSYFELVTASAFVYFADENVDIAILEVGMGGRWDATNVVDPLISVITNISLDHMEHLGDTKELIAMEKAEIIKKDKPVVTAVGGKEIKVINEKAVAENSDLYILGDNFNIKINEDNTFNYNGINSDLENISTNLYGHHQVINSSLALASAELLKNRYGYILDAEKTVKALKSVNYQGRFEILKTNPIMVLDAAHNTSAALSLIKAIKELEENKIVFLLSMLSDKNHEEFISVLSGVAEKVVITAIPNERAAKTKILYDISKKYLDDVEVVEDYKEAYKYVNTLNKTVCITGSVYLIGHIKEILNKRD